MLHHLFKNAAPGSNAAIWRGLFYKEWLHSSPKYWIPLILWAAVAFFLPAIANPVVIMLPLSWAFFMVYSNSHEASGTAEFCLCLPSSPRQQLIARALYHSSPLLFVPVTISICYYLRLGEWILAEISPSHFVWNIQVLDLKHLPTLWLPILFLSFFPFEPTPQKGWSDIAFLGVIVWLVLDKWAMALGYNPEACKSILLITFSIGHFAAKIYQAGHSELPPETQTQDTPTAYWNLKTIDIAESRRQLLFKGWEFLRKLEPVRFCAQRYCLRQPCPEPGTEASIWRGLIWREAQLSSRSILFIGSIWIFLMVFCPPLRLSDILFNATFILTLMLAFRAKIDTTEEFMLCQAPTWRQQIQAQLLVHLLPLFACSLLAMSIHFFWYSPHQICCTYLHPVIIGFYPAARRALSLDTHLSLSQRFAWLLFFFITGFALCLANKMEFALEGPAILAAYFSFYWILMKGSQNYQFSSPPTKED